MSGKGMAPRKGYNQQRYAENYDGIFRRTQNTMNDDDKKTNPVLPWHAKATRSIDVAYMQAANKGDAPSLRFIESIIAAHDPHMAQDATTVRLLEELIQAHDKVYEHERWACVNDAVSKARAHLAK